ncbi:MAG: radical SAM protein, partial [Pseudomonadota bacterium]
PERTEKTFCHYPWTTLYIEPNGEVYPCCHRRPRPVGDIYAGTLEEILLGPEAEQVRREAQSGSLTCFENCTRAPRRRYYNSGDQPYEVEARPKLEEVHINISTRCNLSCLMCGQDHKSRLTLDYKRLIQAVDWSKGPRLIIQGGEPLVVPAAFKLAAYVRRKASPLTLITNATAFTSQWREILLEGKNECRISLNAASRPTHEAVNRGSRWPKVLAAVRRLAAEREKRKSGLYITLRMTVLPQNAFEMPEFVRFGNAEGYADRITFGFDKKTMPRWAHKNRKEFLGIYQAFMTEVSRSRAPCDAWRMYQLACSLGLENKRYQFGRKGELLSLPAFDHPLS